MSDQSVFDASWSVNDTIARYPETVAVFNAFGIDACCGGAASVEDAATRDAADPQRVVDALHQIIRVEHA